MCVWYTLIIYSIIYIYIIYTLSLNTFGVHFTRWGLQQAETAMLQRLREDLPRDWADSKGVPSSGGGLRGVTHQGEPWKMMV